jgi:hypothetical protein
MIEPRVLRALLLVAAAVPSHGFVGGDGDFNLGTAVRGIPGAIKSNLKRFRSGCGEMWVNSKRAKVVRQAVLQDGRELTYADLQLLRRSGEDFSKLVQAGFLWLFAPELVPAMLYFYPRAMPSTFETDQGREKRRGTLARMRTTAALELLATLEEQSATQQGKKALIASANCERAEQLLRQKTVSRALVFVQDCATMPRPDDKSYKMLDKIAQTKQRQQRKAKLRVGKTTGAGKIALLGISPAALKAGCKMIGVSGPQPGLLRRGALGKHLEGLVQEDAILASSGTARLGREELLEACLDRGFGSSLLTDADLRKLLDEWVELVQSRAAENGADGATFEPHRLRLAAMGACSAAAIRRESDSMSRLPRLVYAK